MERLKQDKGVAGLTVLLSLIVMLFVIGLLVMIFTLMGSEMQSSIGETETTENAINESIATSSTAGVDTYLANYIKLDATCGDLTAVYNTTAVAGIDAKGNFTQDDCHIVNSSSMVPFADTNLVFNYPYTYTANNTATGVIFDTTQGISGTTDWFDIFIVIGAMVVLILLTVIIITAIRSSGMVTTSGSKVKNVGTA